MSVGRRERAGRAQVARPLDVELLALDEAAELRLELGLREPRGGEEGRKIGADLGRVAADLTGAREVVTVGRLVIGPGAALDPHREQDDDEDRERDEPRQPEQGRDPVRRPDLRSARPRPPPPCGPPPGGRPPVREGGAISRVSSSTKSKSRMSSSCTVTVKTPAEPVALDVRSNPFSGRVYGRFGGEGRSPGTAKDGYRCRPQPSHSPIERSSSTAIGRLKPLGRGGSGSVWLARDEQTGLEVALKIVPREGKRAARAAREMEAASRLRHERCVRAYDFGGDTGHVYIAYEYVRGRTLREASARGGGRRRGRRSRLPHRCSTGLRTRTAAESSIATSSRRTCWSRTRDDISVRVLDFGLAQFDEADTLTAVGDVPGTLAYISPERLSGKEASERSDVWAVGVILWEALAGSHPFWGVPLPQVASTIASGAPPLSARRGDLPRRLLAAIDAALSVDPAKRPQAARLAADLREAFVVPLTRTRPERKPARAARVAKPPRPKAAPVPLWQRLAPAGMASLATLVGGSLVPFWPGPLLAALAVSRGPRRVPCPTPRARRCPGGAGVPARKRRAGGCRRLRRSSRSPGWP